MIPSLAFKVIGLQFREQGSEWLFVKCPFHSGETDDLTKVHGRINPENGIFKCHSCGKTTSMVGFIAQTTGKPPSAVELALDTAVNGQGGIGPAVVEQFNSALMQNQQYKEKLLEKHGIGLEEIATYKLGLMGQSDGVYRVTIPVIASGIIVNIRLYSYVDRNNKMMNWKGLGKKRIYLEDNIAKSTDVYIAEGEFKAILLNKMGFNAVAPTAGASSWDHEWSKLFNEKHVVIVYDSDKAGYAGAERVALSMQKYAASVRKVILPLNEAEGVKDITDYFVTLKKTADDFRQLVISTELWEAPVAPTKDEDSCEVLNTSLANSSIAALYNKRVKLQCVVSAKDTAPYVIPAECQVVCDAAKDYCINCHVSTARHHRFKIEKDSAEILSLVDTSDENQFKSLKKIGGIYSGCKACSFKTLSSHNVEEVRLIPQISVGHTTGEMVVRRAFTVAHGTETNQSYEVIARACVEPDSQHSTLVVYSQEKSQDDIDKFEFKHDLTIFQPAEWTKDALRAKLDDIYEDLESNVTKIYKRRALHMFFDLSFHSVLYIPFQGKVLKGWTDLLCIGDSGQGKSETSIRLSSHYKAGERVDTKRASVAGLLGGLQETAGRWFITWGTVPLNDRRLVILEECKGMPIESLATLTDMRSSGVAEIQKIERARTHARTRLLWISNPRSTRKLSEYNYGVDAVRELIGNLEDIRRFDAVIAVASGEVGLDVINRASADRAVVPHCYTSDLCSHLVIWAWSRKESEIILERDAEYALLEAATRMGGNYSSACPIVEPSDQRHKLLRLAGALAARTFSCDDQGNLVIRKCHVELVEEFLNQIYEDKALGYAAFSQAQKGETVLRDPDDISKYIRNMPNAPDSIVALIETEAITFQTVMDCTEWMKDKASEFVGFLVRKQAIRAMRRGGYRKTAAFIDLLKRLDRENLTSETHATKVLNGEL